RTDDTFPGGHLLVCSGSTTEGQTRLRGSPVPARSRRSMRLRLTAASGTLSGHSLQSGWGIDERLPRSLFFVLLPRSARSTDELKALITRRPSVTHCRPASDNSMPRLPSACLPARGGNCCAVGDAPR